MSGLVVRESLGERRFAATDFPIAVGGAGSVIVMSGRPAGAEAYIGVHEDQLFVQPADGAEVLHNGVRVQNSTWLRSGDVVNLGAARLRIAENDERALWSKSTTAAAATSLRRRSSPRARASRDRATATPSESTRFASALPKLRSRSAASR